jgi:hypothetical protein
MKIFVLTKSEDGLDNNCFTNSKALFNRLELHSKHGYKPLTISVYDRVHTFKPIEMKFTYANMLKALKFSMGGDKNFLGSFTIECEDNTSMQIQELNILTK